MSEIWNDFRRKFLLLFLQLKFCLQYREIKLGDKIDESEKASIQAEVDKLKETLKGTDTEAIKAQTEAVTKAFHAVSEKLYQAAMMDPHTAAELSIDDIVLMCDEMLEAHAKSGFACL